MLDFFKHKVEETLARLIPPDSTLFSSLYEGGKYALLAPGKRIRPLLTLSIAEIFRENTLEPSLIPACTIELIHTYSLIHDDLPCMDNDDFRRGLPTLHRVYSEGHAVLIGDYLLTLAFEHLSKAPFLDSEQKMALTYKLAQAAGGEGMIGGQIMDIEQHALIEEIHARKTAALFVAAVEFGGIIAHCTPETLSFLRHFGMQFGKLFQIMDDLQDGDHPLGQQHAENVAFTQSQVLFDMFTQFPGNTNSLKKLIEQVFSFKTYAKAL